MTAAANVQAVLRRRAERLASPRQDADPSDDPVEVLVLTAGDGRQYALRTREVRLVQRNEGLRRLPSSAGAVLGVVPVRSGVVPVVDLAEVLGSGPGDPTRPFVVVLHDAAPLGLLVDAVDDVVTWRATDLRLPGTGAGTAPTAARDARVGPGGVVVLDAGAVAPVPAHRGVES